jgi:hypothetical protein
MRPGASRIGRIVAAMATGRRTLGFLAVTLVALVVSHNLVFLIAYGAGYDEALAHSGHAGAWGTAVAVTLAAAIALFGLGSWRLYRLGVVARALSAGEGGFRPGRAGFVRQLVGLWLGVAAVTTVLFVVQENLERRQIGEALPGLSVLGSAAYPHAAFVITAVALAISFVVALFRWRRDVLVARIRSAATPRFGSPSTSQPRHIGWVERRHASIVVHQGSGRAPPHLGTT